MPTDNEFYKTLGTTDAGTLDSRGIKPNDTVRLYIKTHFLGDTCSQCVGTATIEADYTNPDAFCRTLHNHSYTDNYTFTFRSFKPPDYLAGGMHKVVIEAVLGIRYPYTFNSTDDVPTILKDLNNIRFVWDVRAILPELPVPKPNPSSQTPGPSTRTTPTPSKGPSGLEAMKNSAKKSMEESAKKTPTSPKTTGTQPSLVTTGGYKTANNPDDGSDDDVIIIEEQQDGDEEDDMDSDGIKFKHRTFDKNDYDVISVRAKITQVTDFDHPLRPIDEAHVADLYGTFMDPKYGFEENAGTMSTTVLPKNLAENERVYDLLTRYTAAGVTFYTLTEGRSMTIVDGRHRRKSVLKCHEIDSPATKWSREDFRFSLIIRKDGKLLTEWEVLIFSKQRNDSSSKVKKTQSVGDLMNSIISYSNIFKGTYGISYLEANTTCIVDDLLNSHFMTFARTTIGRYVRLSKCLLRYKTIYNFIFNNCPLASKVEGKKSHISYFTDSRLMNAEEDDMLLMLRCVTLFSEARDTQTFRADNFYFTATAFIDATKDYFKRISSIPTSQDTSYYPKTYAAFMEGLFYVAKTTQTTPNDYIISYMSTHNYHRSEAPLELSPIAKRAITRLKTRLDTRYLPVTPDKAPKQTKSSVTSNLPPRRGKRNTKSVVTIDLEADEPKKKKRKTGGRNSSGGGNTGGSSGGGKSPATRSNSKSNKPALKGAEADRQHEKHAEFDDAFDYSAPPALYENLHSLVANMATVNPPEEFINNVRVRHSVRDAALEENWETEHTIPAGTEDNNTIADISAFLRSVHIPKDHRAHTFVSLQDFKVLRRLVTLWGVYSELFLSEDRIPLAEQASDNWEKVLQQDDYLSTSFFKQKRTELKFNGFAVLEGIADPMNYPPGTLDEEVELPAQFPAMSLGALFDRVHNMFPGEDQLRDEEERKDWNPIVNSGDEPTDKNQRDMGVGRYATTNKFLMKTMETKHNVELARRRAFLDVWIGLVVSQMNLDANGRFEAFIPRTGGRWILTGIKCLPQCGHNDFPVIAGFACPGYFVIVTGLERAYLWVAPGSHNYVYYSAEDRQTLGSTLKMERFTIPPSSIFIGHGHVQHAGDGYSGSHCPRYHTYFSPKGFRIPDAILFAYGTNMACSSVKLLSEQGAGGSTSKTITSARRFPAKSTEGQSTKEISQQQRDDDSVLDTVEEMPTNIAADDTIQDL